MDNNDKIERILQKFMDGSATREEFHALMDQVQAPEEQGEILALINNGAKKRAKVPAKQFSQQHKAGVFRKAMGTTTEGVPHTKQPGHLLAKVALAVALTITAAWLIYYLL